MEQDAAASAPTPASLQCWTLSDGRAGNLRQVEALAHALAPPVVRDWRLAPRAPWRWAAPRRLPGSGHAFGHDFAAALAAPPALAIGCGRQAALATRLLRAHGAKAVQILDPRLDPAHWDLLVVPEHDGARGGNVVSVLGSLHPVDDAWLAQARADFAALADLPRPRTALLLGGGSRHARFDADAFAALMALLDPILARDGGSLLATASRRTPEAVRRALRLRHGAYPGLAWDGRALLAAGAQERDEDRGRNPYPGLLAWADRIVCTPDSVNMLSEACATRAPVYVFDPARVTGRPRRFLDALLARGRIRAMDAPLAPFETEPLRETARVAAQVWRRLGLDRR